MDRIAFMDWASKAGLDVPVERLDALEAFETALYKANEVMNLTRVPQEESWLRHFIDSLLIEGLLPQEAKVLDIGTGPGFPAWPLACVRPDLQVTALDSSGKMLGFLLTQPLPNLTVVNARVEEWGVREDFDVVTGRALAPLALQLELSAAACKVGGHVIPMRVRGELFSEIDVSPLGLKLKKTETRRLGETDIFRAFPIFAKVKKTEARYPRRWAEMKKHPLT